MVVVLARSFFPSLHDPRSGFFEPATGSGELPASFHARLRERRHAWKRFCRRFGSIDELEKFQRGVELMPRRALRLL
eukprot:5516388-Pyramimonas_sp.AAC.1